MALRRFRRYFIIAFLSLAVNALLFAGLPNMLTQNTAPADIEMLQMVDFVQRKPERKKAQEEKRPKKIRPPEPPRVVPRKVVKQAQQPTLRPLTMEMPSLRLDMAPGFTAGVPVSAPPVEPAPVQAAPQAPAVKAFYGMEEVDRRPTATIKSPPAYPYRARRLNIDGRVDVKFLVDKEGRVSRISILKADPPNLFEDNVIRALAAWRFSPGRVAGQPVNTWVSTTIMFRMDDL